MNSKGIVLLVDDNADLNANNIRALQMHDYKVHSALTLAQARAWLVNNEADVILLDVILPDGDGIGFCAEIRGAPLQTGAHILFLTALTGYADRVRGLANGGDDYITKPFHPEELLARVEAAMRRRSMSQVIGQETQPASDVEEKKLIAFAATYGLSNKEITTLSLILRRLSTKKMAEIMGISSKGVEFHITKILLKTGANKRLDIIQTFFTWKM